MEIMKKQVDVFKVGNKEFFTLVEAEAYEKEVENKLSCTYYLVTYAPDLTEGRGYYKKFLVGIKNKYNTNAITQFLVTKLGQPIVKVQGVSPMDNWLVSQPHNFVTIEEYQNFIDMPLSVGIGGYKTKEKLDLYVIDSGGEVIEIIFADESKESANK